MHRVAEYISGFITVGWSQSDADPWVSSLSAQSADDCSGSESSSLAFEEGAEVRHLDTVTGRMV